MEKTIAAISTAMSASGIGIVRISGDEAMDVIFPDLSFQKWKEKYQGSAESYHSLWIYL